jgi:hypothetical protein
MSPARELAEHLKDAGIVPAVGGSAPWSVHVSREPPNPDAVVTLYDTGGFDAVLIDEADILSHPTIQVRVRCRNYDDGYAKHEAIKDELVLPTHRVIGDHRYVGIYPQGDITGIGRDDQDRQLITANYRILRQSTGVST